MPFKKQTLLSTLQLLRIPFSFLLMPVFLLALSQVPELKGFGLADWVRILQVFVILHLLVYPSSNGYNSYVDQDTGPIGGLKAPPKPTQALYYVTWMMDSLAIVWALWINGLFAIGVAGYIAASRAYSSDRIRLKKHPWAGFWTVFCFQGAWTFVMVLAGILPAAQQSLIWQNTYLMLALACSCLVGGVYPLTQIYQHQADAERGDKSLSQRLGYRGSFGFAGGLIALSQTLFWMTLPQIQWLLMQACLAPIALYFVYWAYQVWNNTHAASFEGSMRLNYLAASCMNLCFGGFVIMGCFQ